MGEMFCNRQCGVMENKLVWRGRGEKEGGSVLIPLCVKGDPRSVSFEVLFYFSKPVSDSVNTLATHSA